MAVTTYCTQDDISDRLSETGVDLRIDDSPPSTLGRVLERAAVMVNRYCQTRYTVAQLAMSDHVRELAADIATYYLCIRRGNPAPPYLVDLFNDAKEALAQINQGVLQLPDIAQTRPAFPAMSNPMVAARPTLHARVQTRRSVGKQSGRTIRKDIRDPLLYGDYQI